MAKRALIFIEGHRSLGLLYAKAARFLGLCPITLSMHPTQYEYLAAEKLEAVRVDTDNLAALILECSRLRSTYDLAGITGFTGLDESVYATVGKLCRHFDLPGPNPTSVEQCCDKFKQRELLAEAGVPQPVYRLAANAAEIRSCAAEIGFPVILKPAIGSGSSGVRLCRNLNELGEHTIRLMGGKHTSQSSPRILVEEFAQGPYYIADMMGKEVVAVVAGDFGPPPYFVMRKETLPAPLADDECKRIADLSLSSLRALGLGWGPSNVGFRWTTRGPVVIEVNPRVPGAPDPQMIRLAYGIDLVAEHIKLVIGEEGDLRKRHSHTAGARFLVPDRDGILDWIDGDSRAAAVPGVAEVELHIRPKVPIVRAGNYQDTIGHVIGASPSRAQTDAILQHAVALIDWSISPFPSLGEQKQPPPSISPNDCGDAGDKDVFVGKHW